MKLTKICEWHGLAIWVEVIGRFGKSGIKDRLTWQITCEFPQTCRLWSGFLPCCGVVLCDSCLSRSHYLTLHSFSCSPSRNSKLSTLSLRFLLHHTIFLYLVISLSLSLSLFPSFFLTLVKQGLIGIEPADTVVFPFFKQLGLGWGWSWTQMLLSFMKNREYSAA